MTLADAATRRREINRVANFQRYYYYIEKGINPCEISQPPPEQRYRLEEHLSDALLASPLLKELLAELHAEVGDDYDFSYRKSVGEWPVVRRWRRRQ